MVTLGHLAVTFLVAAVVAVAPQERVEDPAPNPLPLVISSIPDFDVRRFEARAMALSDRNYINFEVSLYPHAAPAHCFALGTSADETLTSIPQTWCAPGRDQAHGITGQHDPNNINSGGDPWTASDDVWFSWTMGVDVDPLAPGSDTIFGMHKKTGAYLKIVRQLGEHTRDEAVLHFPQGYLEVVGEGELAHQIYTGPQNISMGALRFEQVAH